MDGLNKILYFYPIDLAKTTFIIYLLTFIVHLHINIGGPPPIPGGPPIPPPCSWALAIIFYMLP